MHSGIMLMKKFLCEALDLLDDSYITVAVVPGRDGNVTGIGFSIHDGHNTVSFSWPLSGPTDLAVLDGMTGMLQLGLQKLRETARAIILPPEKEEDERPTVEQEGDVGSPGSGPGGDAAGSGK